MAFRGQKEGTKDIDVVVLNRRQAGTLISAISSLGYTAPTNLTIDYKKMRAITILENSDGFRWDIFVRIISDKLGLSYGMITRSQPFLKQAGLTVRLLSNEDIFLLKSVTERDLDLDDMRILAEGGLNWKIISQECLWQSSVSETIWEDALCNALKNLREKHNITSPIENKICAAADAKILHRWIITQVRAGTNTVTALSEAAGESAAVIRSTLRELVRRGEIRVKKTHRQYTYSIASGRTV